jgi:hypothetical protein
MKMRGFHVFCRMHVGVVRADPMLICYFGQNSGAAEGQPCAAAACSKAAAHHGLPVKDNGGSPSGG